jgi:hypothetical protein
LGNCSLLALRWLRSAATTSASISAAGTRPTRWRGLILQHGLGDVIAVAGAALVGVGWAHAVAAIVKKAPAQDGGRAPQPAAPRARLGRKLGLHRLEQGTIYNRRLFAAVDLATVDHLADIEAVLEKMGERPHAKAPPADGPAVRQPPRLAANSPAIEVLRQRADGAKLQITGKDCANRKSTPVMDLNSSPYRPGALPGPAEAIMMLRGLAFA